MFSRFIFVLTLSLLIPSLSRDEGRGRHLILRQAQHEVF